MLNAQAGPWVLFGDSCGYSTVEAQVVLHSFDDHVGGGGGGGRGVLHSRDQPRHNFSLETALACKTVSGRLLRCSRNEHTALNEAVDNLMYGRCDRRWAGLVAAWQVL